MAAGVMYSGLAREAGRAVRSRQTRTHPRQRTKELPLTACIIGSNDHRIAHRRIRAEHSRNLSWFDAKSADLDLRICAPRQHDSSVGSKRQVAVRYARSLASSVVLNRPASSAGSR